MAIDNNFGALSYADDKGGGQKGQKALVIFLRFSI